MPVAGLVMPGTGSPLLEEDILRVATEAITSAPDSPSRIFIVERVSSKSLHEKILQKIEQFDLTPDQRQSARDRVTFIETNLSPSTWHQDYLHNSVGPGDGRARIYYLGHYDDSKSGNSGQSTESFLRFMRSAETSNLGGQVVFQKMPDLQINPPHAGHYGGNLLSLPDGSCVIGKSKFKTEKEARDFALSLDCTEALVVDTSWLRTSHADEILSYLNSNGHICNTAFRVPSASFAVKIMRSRPEDNFIRLEELDANSRVNLDRQLNANPEVKEACLAKYGSLDQRCLQITNADFLDFAPKTFWLLNQDIDRRIQKIRMQLTRFIQKKHKCSPRFLDAPQLFTGVYEESKPSSVQTIHPNAVNTVLLSRSVLVPTTGNEGFDQWNEKVFKENAHKPVFLNTYSANISGGNAHCMIKAIRMCQPQKK